MYMYNTNNFRYIELGYIEITAYRMMQHHEYENPQYTKNLAGGFLHISYFY